MVYIEIATCMSRMANNGADCQFVDPSPSLIHRLYNVVSTPICCGLKIPRGSIRQMMHSMASINKNNDCLR